MGIAGSTQGPGQGIGQANQEIAPPVECGMNRYAACAEPDRQPPPVQTIVIAKEPVTGRAKTRLTPPYTPRQAATLARAALVDTLEAVRRFPAQRRVLALSGRPGPWLPSGFDVIDQRGAGLDERLACAFADSYTKLRLPVLLVGMDTPQLTAGLLRHAAATLASGDAVLGPASDGGFWLLGLREPRPDLLRGVPMSTGQTGGRQLDRLRHAGLRVGLLPTLTDVDTAAEAQRVAAYAPWTHFAATLRTWGRRP